MSETTECGRCKGHGRLWHGDDPDGRHLYVDCPDCDDGYQHETSSEGE